MTKYSFAIGNRIIGNGNDVLIQTRNRKKTECIQENLEELRPLIPCGLDRIRFSVLDSKDAKALKVLKSERKIPLIADIHYQPELAFLSIENGADKVRINPGNWLNESSLRRLVSLCKEKNIPIRIGVNSGSLNKYKGKGKNEIDDYFLALSETLSFFQEEGFTNLVLSLKSSSVNRTKNLYERAYQKYPYPLHIGLTESGFGLLGARKTTAAVLPLLEQGIGDTLRVSLADNRMEEIRACKELLRLSGRRNNIPELIVCPSCGRRAENRRPIADEVLTRLDTINKNIKVAIMGCPVNGVGEAKDADYGLAGTGKKNLLLFFCKGKVIGTYPKEEARQKLLDAMESD